MTEALRNSMGEVGRAAVVARALASTKQAHPALTELSILGDDGVRVDDIAASISAHGHQDVAAAIDALIGAVQDILTRLIGADMAQQLIDDGARQSQPQDRAGES